MQAREPSDDDGFTSVSIDLDERSVTLYWRGPVAERVRNVVERVRVAGIPVHVRTARYSLVQLRAAIDAVMATNGAARCLRICAATGSIPLWTAAPSRSKQDRWTTSWWRPADGQQRFLCA